MTTFNPYLVTIVAVTTLGILLHDVHIDKAAVAVQVLPSAVNSTETLKQSLVPNYHTHVERAELPRPSAFRSSLPNTRPPREDGRTKYVQNKRLLFSGGDAASFWPST